MSADGMEQTWEKFFQERGESLWHRFPGYYRALVVETNDPLCMQRVRFLCPDLHDWDLTPDQCPWAVPCGEMGSKRCGRWSSPCIGDWIWITFERGHPYGPVWVGFADPTRRKFYAYPSVAHPTPLSVNESGQPADRPDDYQADYLPGDGRPMSHGWQDRYGNLDISSSVGFFPAEHALKPASAGFDPVQASDFRRAGRAPKQNAPDVKHMARITKYGIICLMHDQGYSWQKDGDYGEFSGDFARDEAFEIRRWKYLNRLLNEDKPTGHDGRRFGINTRYGHKIEARDVGWAQPGPVASMSRPGEYDTPAYLSRETDRDFRWIKLRTKGGMLRQMYDKGCDPQDDDYVKRLLLDEVDDSTENEHKWWGGKDARQIRDVTRHGYKIVLDDRGSDPKRADSLESPRGNGILIKGRRTGGSQANKGRTGDPRGFYWEFNENDDANHTTWGTPLGLVMEMNDATEYICLAAGLGRDYAMPWQGIKENEFLRRPTRRENPEDIAHHFILDQQNEYIRLKTRGGHGPGPDDPGVNPSDLGDGYLNQGFEAHDGSLGDGAWCEMVDSEDRGLWLSKKYKLGVWRSSSDSGMFLLQDDLSKRVVVYNGEAGGKVQIYCAGDVEVVSAGTVAVKAGRDIGLKAAGTVRIDGGGTLLTVGNGTVQSNRKIKAEEFNGFLPGCRSGPGVGLPSPGGMAAPDPAAPAVPAVLGPGDRGKVYNSPSVVPDNEIEHPI